MTNKILLYSSLFFGIIHILINDKIHFIGVFTSILNHFMTNKYIKIIDRSIMVISAIIDFYIIKQLPEYIILAAAICMYFLAKHYGNDLYHIAAHFFITVLHLFERF